MKLTLDTQEQNIFEMEPKNIPNFQRTLPNFRCDDVAEPLAEHE